MGCQIQRSHVGWTLINRNTHSADLFFVVPFHHSSTIPPFSMPPIAITCPILAYKSVLVMAGSYSPSTPCTMCFYLTCWSKSAMFVAVPLRYLTHRPPVVTSLPCFVLFACFLRVGSLRRSWIGGSWVGVGFGQACPKWVLIWYMCISVLISSGLFCISAAFSTGQVTSHTPRSAISGVHSKSRQNRNTELMPKLQCPNRLLWLPLMVRYESYISGFQWMHCGMVKGY